MRAFRDIVPSWFRGRPSFGTGVVVFPWVCVEVFVEVVCVVVSEVAVNVDVLVYSEMLMSPGAGLAGVFLPRGAVPLIVAGVFAPKE